MKIKNIFYILISLAIVFEIFGDILLKKWSINQKGLFFGLGIFIYTASTILWGYSLKYEFLSKAVSIMTIVNLIVVVLLGVFLFKENLSVINKIGILLGIISVILIEI
jgi:multidrug transporter EmrE-like cation transporter